MRPLRILLALVVALGAAALPAAADGPPYPYTYERTTVPMRDGVRLSVDIWRPVTGGTKVPVILTLTPYHVLYKALDRREDDVPTDLPFVRTLVPQGYAYARADVRGTYNSGGCWDYGGIKERQDGYDIVEWFGGVMADGVTPSPAAAWSNGRVAMTGASYDGTTANAAAVENPPHLATIVPISAISRWWGYAYQQGTRSSYSGESLDIDPPSDTPADFMFVYGNVPPPDPAGLNDAQQLAMRWNLCDRVQQTLKGYSTQPDYDAFWEERDYLRRASQVAVPVLVAHGFLDFNVKTWEGTAWYQALPGEKMLVAGQWPHQLPGYGQWNALTKRWFERWLYDVPNGVENEAPVIVAANSGGFRMQQSWGEGPKTVLNLSGGEFTFFDDGLLTESEMLRGIGNGTRFKTVNVGGGGLHIEGRPVLHLRARSDQPNTHYVAVLTDVAPNGARTVISRAFLNTRYNDSLASGTELTPNTAHTFRLEFIDKDWYVPAANRLELIIASSSNTWVAPNELRARNTLLLDESVLEIPTGP